MLFMPKRLTALYLQDIKSAIQKIEKYTKGLSFEQFQKNVMIVDAVVRNLEIIGEASRHIPQETRKKCKDIPWQEMADMRNKVIHEYFGIDIVILWKTVKDDLSLVKREINKL